MQLITDHFGEPNAKSLDTEEHASRFVRCVPVLSAHHAANMGVVESTLLLQYNEAKRDPGAVSTGTADGGKRRRRGGGGGEEEEGT